MTCIVGLVEGKKVYMGGDSAAVSATPSSSLKVRSDPKVFRNGDFLIGYTTSFRMGQLLRFNLVPPACPDDIEPYEYMVSLFIPAVRKCLKDGGYARKDNERESAGEFMVAYKGILFDVESDYQVGTIHDPFCAVGSGAQVALGALTVTDGLPGEERVRKALEAAERWCSNVRGPFTIETMGEEQDGRS